MGIIDLTSDLSAGAGDNLSQHGGRHGGLSNETPSMPAHSIEHSQLDTGVGNSSNAQTFNDGHGYTVTGNKEFTRPNESALANMLEAVGGQYNPTSTGVETGPVNYFSGVTGEWGPGTLPAGFTFNMAYGDSKLAPNDTMALSTTRHTVGLDTLEPITFAAPNAYDSDFMTTPIANNISNLQGFSDSLTHNVSMITLTGPTAGETYQTAINTTPSTLGAHGSAFKALPIASFISRYAPPGTVSVLNPDIDYDDPAKTIPISYAKTRAAFNHHTAIPFADSLHWAEGDVALAAHNPITIVPRQMGRIAPPPVQALTKTAIKTTFTNGQPTFNIPKQYNITGNYKLQTRAWNSDDDENKFWDGTYILNSAPTIPSSILQFASISPITKTSRFDSEGDINMSFTDIFGHSYAALAALNSNIALPVQVTTPGPTDSWFQTYGLADQYTSADTAYPRKAGIQLENPAGTPFGMTTEVVVGAFNESAFQVRSPGQITGTINFLASTRTAIGTAFVDGKQPTFNIPEQYSMAGTYGLQIRYEGGEDDPFDWGGTYIPNKAPTKPTAVLQFAGLSRITKDSRFKTDDAINMTFTDIFGHAYEALSSLNSNIIIPADSPAHFTSYDDEKKYGSITFSSGKQTVGSRLTGDSNTKIMEPYTNEFQLGKDHQNSPKFKNTGFAVGGAYYPDETLGKSISDSGTAITVKTDSRVNSLENLHKNTKADRYAKSEYSATPYETDSGNKRLETTGYRANNVIGFDQPYIIAKIPEDGRSDLLNFDAGIIRGGLITSISRTIKDVLRVGSFILTTKGILFGLKQVALQTLNTKEETRTWNPLSLGSIVPTVHINRHWNTGSPLVSSTTLEVAPNPLDSKEVAPNPLDSKLVDWGEKSLNYYFRKEEAIIDDPGTPLLLSKLGQLLGNNAEQSREIDRNQFKWNTLKQKSAVTDSGDQGTSGIVKFNYDKTYLGYSIADYDGQNKYITSKVDKVNALPYGSDNDGKEPNKIGGQKVHDFIPFKFKDVVNGKWIIFRAILSGISDSVTPDWSEERYIGRPDKVYTYAGVDREISFNFNVYPKTKQELPILWEKMNYLVGMCYPSWRDFSNSDMERMVSPFAELTIGNMWTGAPGFLTSLSITVEDNTTWELDDHFKLPKHLSVSVGYKYIGKHKPAQKGKHYDLDWLDYKNTNNINSDPYLDNPTGNYPDRHPEKMDMRKLFAEMGQSGEGPEKIPSWED